MKTSIFLLPLLGLLALGTGCTGIGSNNFDSSTEPNQATIIRRTEEATEKVIALAAQKARTGFREKLDKDESVLLVATPSNLNGDLKQTEEFGRILQEAMLQTAANFTKMPVLEHRMAIALDATKDGEFILSRELEEIVKKQNVRIILTGTYNRGINDTVVNLRALDALSGEVLGANTFTLRGDVRLYTR